VDRPIELVPLLCIQCSVPIQAGNDEIAWACENCGRGQMLDEIEGLTSLEIFFSADIPPNSLGKPYWVTGATVSLQREAYGILWKTKRGGKPLLEPSAPILHPRFRQFVRRHDSDWETFADRSSNFTLWPTCKVRGGNTA
jgi:hypothetical protein